MHSEASDAEEVDDSACDKDDKPPVWQSVSLCCSLLNSVNFVGTLVSLPVAVLENFL